MRVVLLWATCAHEYMDIVVNIDGHCTWERLYRAGRVLF